jgi:uridine kinase
MTSTDLLLDPACPPLPDSRSRALPAAAKRGLVIGIAGGSASGKSSLATHIAQTLGPAHCTVLALDRYYRDHPRLTPAESRQLDYDHPNAIESSLLLSHLRNWHQGREVEVPHYDYATHRRAPHVTRLHPTPILIIEGLFVLAEARLRRALDLKIFVHTASDLRLLRRIKRDTTERGQTLAEVLERYETRVRPGHERHVAPTRRHADLVWDQGNDETFPDRLIARLRQNP